MLTHFLITTNFQKAAPSPFLPLTPAQRPEQKLLDAARGGDQYAQATLVRQHYKWVLAIALNVTGKREDAEEATQDTFVRAFRYLPDFRGDSSFRTWLRRIARTTALNQLRLKGLPSVSLDTPESSPAYFLTEKNESALERLLRDERAALVKTALQRLSKEDETALKLFYFHEQSLEEICATTGWTVNNAKSRLHRARKRLREMLGKGLDA